MERLTKRINGKAAFYECNSTCGTCEGVLCGSVFLMADRLAAYEDTGLDPERVAELAQAEKDGRLVALPPNDLLTLEELREMDGEPVWVELLDCNKEANWAFVDLEIEAVRILKGMAIQRRFKAYGNTWMAYRRKPEKCVSTPADPAVPGWAKHLNSRFLRAE